MYVAIDVGGTKTFLACLDDQGVITEQIRFATPHEYPAFLRELAQNVAKLSTKEFTGGAIGIPGRIDRNRGVVVACGNLPWHDIAVKEDCERMLHCSIAVENDANLAGLSEAMLLQEYDRVLYVTISTGIGTGVIVHQNIDEAFADSEGGHIELEYEGKLQLWETFASGHAIMARYHKQAHDITDEETWQHVAHAIALGLVDLIAMMQPQVIVLGGGVGHYYARFSGFLNEELKRYATPLVPLPPIREAQRPDEAVVYGCYDLAKKLYGNVH